jgi:MFS family permease
MQIPILYCTSVICGFCMMALEMMGGRFLQPVFGTGIDVWCAIISVFILSLSVGYVLGGRIADRFHTNRALAWVILIAGCYYLLLPIFARPATDAFGEAMHGSTVGSLVAALVLFLPPSLLLGCVSPMLVKLVFDLPERIGRITGTLYAIGSVGNVLGTLTAVYVLLWLFSLNANMIGMGVILCLTALLHFYKPMTSRSPAVVEAMQPAALDTIAEGTA